ncbi:MAG TPA: N-acetyltransferase [Candidatus Hydrogenedentes bacterium]|nr:N-acetyltransferase [Candidatus Hydrogenedentota bacterium]
MHGTVETSQEHDSGGGAETSPATGELRKPKLTEVVALKALIDGAGGAVLSRELRELYENVRDFYVYVDERGLGGCVALHIDMIDLAEVRTLVVRPDLQRRGIGRRLLAAVLDEARGLDIARVYAFTREPAFFGRNGFYAVDRSELPYKVFKDCTRCRLFPGCDETAMVKDLRSVRNQGD